MNQIIKNGLFVFAMFLPGTVGVGSAISSQAGCTPQEAKTVTKDVLSFAQLACVLASSFTSAPEIAQACDIESRLVPLLDPLLAQKAAAKRAGACAPARDAGSAD